MLTRPSLTLYLSAVAEGEGGEGGVEGKYASMARNTWGERVDIDISSEFVHQGSNGGLCVEDVGHISLDILDELLVGRVCAVGVGLVGFPHYVGEE